jgi:hypothetical protein
MIPNGNGHFGHRLTLFSLFLRYFPRLRRINFSQIPQALFTELIGLSLLFSLYMSTLRVMGVSSLGGINNEAWSGLCGCSMALSRLERQPALLTSAVGQPPRIAGYAQARPTRQRRAVATFRLVI